MSGYWSTQSSGFGPQIPAQDGSQGVEDVVTNLRTAIADISRPADRSIAGMRDLSDYFQIRSL
jgi:hypothetical protein